MKNAGRILRALAVPAMVLVLVPASTAPAIATDHAATVAPPSIGAWFGAHVSPRKGLGQFDSIRQFEREIGRRLDVTDRFHGLNDHRLAVEQRMISGGRIPMISWRATSGGVLAPNRASQIAAGRFDGDIKAMANAVRALRATVLVRFAWEMDQKRGQRQYIGGPSAFIAAWRHVFNLFQRQGATNARFVWAPRAAAFNSGKASSYYPGDGYVDWIGASAVPAKTFHAFHTTFARFYSWGSRRGKPLMVWTGIAEKPRTPGWKAKWLTNTALQITAWPKIKAWVYFNAKYSHNNFWADSSTSAKNHYTADAHLSYFKKL